MSWSCNVKKAYKICCLPGDGIGPEIIAEGKKVLAAVGARWMGGDGFVLTHFISASLGKEGTCH